MQMKRPFRHLVADRRKTAVKNQRENRMTFSQQRCTRNQPNPADRNQKQHGINRHRFGGRRESDFGFAVHLFDRIEKVVNHAGQPAHLLLNFAA